MESIWIDGMMGLVIGDALGLPVQFMFRSELKANPVTTMMGYGTFNMPPGTWSDDGSMAIATMESIKHCRGINPDDIMARFIDWTVNGAYTPAGMAFDQGNTCMEGIRNYMVNMDYKTCGKQGERANGNGALMRIMPVCLYGYEKLKSREMTLEEVIDHVHLVSALTHNHIRSKMACGIYYFLVAAVLDEKGSLNERLQKGMDNAKRFYKKEEENLATWTFYERMEDLEEFAKTPESRIKSSGYVVDSLEAAVWSLINTTSFEMALIVAVNLGEDTDTVGAIAGGLAGLYYGYDNVPLQWKETIVRGDEIVGWCGEMCGK